MARRPKRKTGSKPKRPQDSKQLPQGFPVTEAFARHWKDLSLLLGFLGTISGLGESDKERFRYAEIALKNKTGEFWDPPNPLTFLEETWKKSESLSPYRQIFFEMLLCRIIDNFLIYLSELLYLIYETRSEILTRSKDSVPIQVIFQHSSIDDLRSEVIERRIMELSYRGMKALQTYLAEPTQIGFKLFTMKHLLLLAVDVIEVRNLIVHNRGIVNKTFLSKTSTFNDRKVGDRLEISGKQLGLVDQFLIATATDIDDRASKKFKLPRPFTSPPESRTHKDAKRKHQ